MILSFLGPSRKLLEGVKHQLIEESKHFGLAPLDSFEPIKGLRGGIGSVQIIRYHMSSVGPYDELLIVPGAFKPPPGCPNQGPGLRVTQIYVSSLESVLNGRRNWNIPKKLARFEFRQVEGSATKIELNVYGLRSYRFTPCVTPTGWYFEPDFYETPFFNVTMDRHLPRVNVPVNVGKLPLLDLSLLQPPLQAADSLDPESPEVNCAMVGTSDWKRTNPRVKGSSGLCSFKGNFAGRKGHFSDGDLFPEVRPYRLGIHFPRIFLEFPPPTILLSTSKEKTLKH